MYAIIREGGRQYRVSEGDRIEVQSHPGPVGSEVVFPEVLLYGDQAGVEVGRPRLSDVQVHGVVERAVKGPKLRIFRYRRRKDSRVRRGHRQGYLAVRITRIVRGSAG
jgi:large subunit ribosomal protein L21